LKKKILILGASGFIGKNIALNLSKNKNYNVRNEVNTLRQEVYELRKLVLAKC
jgi:nucleoside-diphosphate-sugar epimerase